MPLTARANIFVGSPDELQTDRVEVLRAAENVSNSVRDLGIELNARDFTSMLGDIGNAQSIIDREIRMCDLVILLIGHGRAVGTIHEFDIARQAWNRGAVRSVLLFFKSSKDNEMIETAVQRFASRAQKQVFYHCYQPGSIAQSITPRLREWTIPLADALRIARHIRVEDNTVATMRVLHPEYSTAVVELKRKGWTKEMRKRGDKLLYRYVKGNIGTLDSPSAWLIARRMYEIIGDADPTMFEHRPFVNPIHQFFSDFIRSDLENGRDGEYELRISTLKRWIVDYSNVMPIARNFAAFELGMCRDYESVDLLMERLKQQTEDIHVRYYAGCALGMLKLRGTLSSLVEIFDRETLPDLKNVIGHAVLETAGLLD